MSVHIWIIQMKEKGAWVPTVGASLTLRDSLHELKEWRERCKNDQFRTVKYVPTKRAKKYTP